MPSWRCSAGTEDDDSAEDIFAERSITSTHTNSFGRALCEVRLNEKSKEERREKTRTIIKIRHIAESQFGEPTQCFAL